LRLLHFIRARIISGAMGDQEILSGLIRLHILYHAAHEGLFGLGMIRELRAHGYRIGPGTLYPMLHRMEERGYLKASFRTAGNKQQRWYFATAKGKRALSEARERTRELFREIVNDETPASRGKTSRRLQQKRTRTV
jgi:DNA-binding PadR family transcriptional regulator